MDNAFGTLLGSLGILIWFIELFFNTSILFKNSNKDLMLDIKRAIVFEPLPSRLFFAMKALKSEATNASKFLRDKGPPICSIKNEIKASISL